MISGGSFDPEKLSSDLLAIENKLQDPEIWKDHKKLNEFNKQKTVLEAKVNDRCRSMLHVVGLYC